MTERQWKPGDVAMRVGVGRGAERSFVAHRVLACSSPNSPYRDVPHWHFVGSNRHPQCGGDALATYRPLVVIDPEDSRSVAVEIAQRVCSALNVMPGRDISAGIEATQAALRSLIQPPKPEEPTGLGAVVATDGEGNFVRVSVNSLNPWRNERSGLLYNWTRVTAVRVLSEGVVR